jgi:hypothetical protein
LSLPIIAQLAQLARHSGAERSEEPGIHNHYFCRTIAAPVLHDLWLWIPGSALRAAPE